MLNSAQREIILNAFKHKISSHLVFSGSDERRMLFFLLINVKIPTFVGILVLMSRKKLSMESFNNFRKILLQNLFSCFLFYQILSICYLDGY